MRLHEVYYAVNLNGTQDRDHIFKSLLIFFLEPPK